MPPETPSASPEPPPRQPHGRPAGADLEGETTAFLPADSQATSSSADAAVLIPAGGGGAPQVIGDFEIRGKLGQGGMGTVYRARQISLDRQVALKLLPSTFETDAEFVSRFQREARVAASLSHANLVKVYASGAVDGTHFIAMELIEGETLADFLKRGALPPPEALRICADAARALEYGWHKAQLVHRDIKPGNIFLSVHGDVKVGDLGLAKSLGGDTTGLTQTGTAMGTPHYISPEQARGDKAIDFRADIYSLGCTLFQMLTGRTPYEGRDPLSVMHQHIHGTVPAILKVMPQCPIPLARLVGKMLRKGKHERHASYAELLEQIDQVRAFYDPSLASDPLPTAGSAAASSENTPPPAASTAMAAAAGAPKSRMPLYAGIVAAGVLLLGAVAYFVWPREEKLTQAQLAMKQREAERAAATPAPVVGVAPQAAGGSVPLPVIAGNGGPWTDALAEWWTIPRNADGGMLVKEAGGSRVVKTNSVFAWAGTGTRPQNAALRATASGADRSGWSLSLRWVSDITGKYEARIDAPGSKPRAIIRRFEGTKPSVTLAEEELPKDFDVLARHTCEFRAEGDTLTFIVDGQYSVIARDSVLSAGGAYFTAAPGGLLEMFECRELLAAATAATPAAEPWQEVLPSIDLKRHTLQGEWKIVNGELLGVNGGGHNQATCALPIAATGAFDLLLEMTVKQQSVVATVFTYAGCTGAFTLNGNGRAPGKPLTAGLEKLDGKHVDKNEQSIERGEWLPAGRKHEMLLQVRREGVIAHLDGEEIYRWSGDWKTLLPPPNWGLPSSTTAPVFAIGSMKPNEIVIHRAAWRPASSVSPSLPATATKDRF